MAFGVSHFGARAAVWDRRLEVIPRRSWPVPAVGPFRDGVPTTGTPVVGAALDECEVIHLQ